MNRFGRMFWIARAAALTAVLVVGVVGLSCGKHTASKSVQAGDSEGGDGEAEENDGEAFVESESESERIERERDKILAIEMVPVPGGTFKMGCMPEHGECPDKNKPVFNIVHLNFRHNVTLSGYSIGKYEVTNEQWMAVMGNNPSSAETCVDAKCPASNVTWSEAKEFIGKLNEITGKKYRLPTEAEWEFAARGGTNGKGTVYAGSNKIGDVAWYETNSGSRAHPVGTKAPNELGLYDMSGNVWEWVEDAEGAFDESDAVDPKGSTDSGFARVFRGCGWAQNENDCRVSFRNSGSFNVSKFITLGFRLAMTPD